MFKSFSQHCQSCGMPLAKDIAGGGTEADGVIRSTTYCSHCYANGQFTDPNITMPQMQDKVIGKLTTMGFPKFAAKFMTRNVPRLKRWSKN